MNMFIRLVVVAIAADILYELNVKHDITGKVKAKVKSKFCK